MSAAIVSSQFLKERCIVDLFYNLSESITLVSFLSSPFASFLLSGVCRSSSGNGAHETVPHLVTLGVPQVLTLGL